MRYYRNNQRKLRVELYKGIMDSIKKNKTAADIGKVIILPSTHGGSERQLFEDYQDSMATVGHYGIFLDLKNLI